MTELNDKINLLANWNADIGRPGNSKIEYLQLKAALEIEIKILYDAEAAARAAEAAEHPPRDIIADIDNLQEIVAELYGV